MKTFGAIIVVLVACFGFLALVQVISTSPLWGEAGAAWVQAIGATVGIGLAVWLPYKQGVDEVKAARESQMESQKRVCMAFRDELTLLHARTKIATNVQEMLRDAPGEIFDREIPMVVDRFPVFKSMVGRLTEIADSAVRLAVLDAYEHMNGMITSGQMNSQRLFRFNQLKRDALKSEAGLFDADLEFERDELIKLRPQLRFLMETSIKRVDTAVVLLNKAIDGFEAD